MRRAIFLVARAGSTRLPNKMMAQVAGRSVLRLQLERMGLVKDVDGIVLCTTSLATDDELATEADKAGAACYRGDPEDVPARLLGAARRFQTEAFALVEGDEVFTDPDCRAMGRVRSLPSHAWLR